MKIPRQFGIFTEKIHGQWFALHPGMKILRQFGIFTEKIHGQRFALHPGMKIPLFFP